MFMTMERTATSIALPVLLLALIGAGGCATSGIPAAMKARVTPGIVFKDACMAPEKYKGTTVMWGGEIIAVKNDKEGATIEVLQAPTDSTGYPDTTDHTEGRFIVFVNRYLDPAVFHSPREVTIIGQIDGSKVQPLVKGELDHSYPRITAGYVHLWPRSQSPGSFLHEEPSYSYDRDISAEVGEEAREQHGIPERGERR
jgi:outer membrane lipoprotein